MMRLLETTSIIYNMEFTVNDLQKHFEACPIVSNITTNCPKAHCKYLWKELKVFTNKIPWGMKAHGKHVLLMPILLDEHGLAQTNQPMYASPTQKALVRGKGLRVDNQPLFILDQETTKNPHKRTKPLRMN